MAAPYWRYALAIEKMLFVVCIRRRVSQKNRTHLASSRNFTRPWKIIKSLDRQTPSRLDTSCAKILAVKRDCIMVGRIPPHRYPALLRLLRNPFGARGDRIEKCKFVSATAIQCSEWQQQHDRRTDGDRRLHLYI